MEKQTIGKFIAALRKANGLTQSDLAEKLAVTNKSVSKWERDECYPDLTLIPVIAEIFNVTSDEILKGARIINSGTAVGAADLDAAMGLQKTDSVKIEKQVGRLIQRTMQNFKQLSVISFTLGLIGVVLLFWSLSTDTDSGISLLFAIPGIVLQMMFSNRARTALFNIDDEIISDKRLLRTSRSIDRFTFNIITMNVISLLGVLFLYITSLYLYSYEYTVSFNNFVFFSVLFFTLAVYICAYVVKTLTIDKNYYDIAQQPKTIRNLKKLNIICLILAAGFTLASLVLGVLSFVLPDIIVVLQSAQEPLYAPIIKIDILFLLSLITIFVAALVVGTIHILIRKKLLKPYSKLK